MTVVTDSASVADALSTTLVILPFAEAAGLLAQFGDVSAVWMSPTGELKNGYRLSGLLMSDAH